MAPTLPKPGDRVRLTNGDWCDVLESPQWVGAVRMVRVAPPPRRAYYGAPPSSLMVPLAMVAEVGSRGAGWRLAARFLRVLRRRAA